MTSPITGPPAPDLVPGDLHTSYRLERLVHEPPDERLSGAVTLQALRPHLTRSLLFFLAFIASWALSIAFFVVSFAAAVSADRFDPQPSPAASGAALVSSLLLLGEVGVVVLWIAALFVPTREPIAEYGLLVEGQGHAASHAYAWIARTIQLRQSPLQVSYAQPGGIPVMVVSNERVRGVVVVRTIGADLYLGWAMWRSRSTVMLVIHLVRDLFEAVGGQRYGNDVRTALNRALRELLHSVVREGVQAALVPSASTQAPEPAGPVGSPEPAPGVTPPVPSPTRDPATAEQSSREQAEPSPPDR